MADEFSQYTLVVAQSGDCFPTAGCRLIPIETGSQSYHEFFLKVISPGGNEFAIERGLGGWSKDRTTPNWMTKMRDRITDAILAGEPQLDLRLPDPNYEIKEENRKRR